MSTILNKTISEELAVKQRGRPKKEICIWNDEEYKSQYFKNYFQIAKQQSEKVECECGKKYELIYKYKHMHSKYHMHYEEIKLRFSPKNI